MLRMNWLQMFLKTKKKGRMSFKKVDCSKRDYIIENKGSKKYRFQKIKSKKFKKQMATEKVGRF